MVRSSKARMETKSRGRLVPLVSDLRYYREEEHEEKKGSARQVSSRRARTRPTPIWISRRTGNLLILAGGLAMLLLMWLSPSVPLMVLGGAAVALPISLLVRALSRFMPQGWAIAASLLALAGLVIVAIAVLLPVLISQLSSVIDNVPAYATDLGQSVRNLLEPLAARGLLPGSPDDLLANLGQELLNLTESMARQVLGGLLGFVSGTFGLLLTLFGMLFVAVYLIVNMRKVKAAYLLVSPRRYRRDAEDLWDAFAFSLSRYLSGLGLVAFIQGVLTAVGLIILGVPYAFVLGAWAAITSVIPYLGAYLGAIPAVVLALFVSPTTALLTILLFLLIQTLEGNFLTPRIQGQTLRIPSVWIFLAVIAGGEIAGLLGIVFALPFVAMLRVLFDFFRARLRTIN